jgi:hypothetical protein
MAQEGLLMAEFIVGLFVGGVLGVLIMALVAGGKED